MKNPIAYFLWGGFFAVLIGIVVAIACNEGKMIGIQYSYDRCMKYGVINYYPDTYYCKLFAGKIKARDEVEP